MKKQSLYLIILFFTSLSTFAQKLIPPLFKPVPNNETGINFANILKESPGLNIITTN